MINPDRQMPPSVAAAVNHFFDFANVVVKEEMPTYYYTAFVVCRLVPANNVNPADLPPGAASDCRPVNTGRSDSRFFARPYFDDQLQDAYSSLGTQVQNGVGVSGGISITIFGVQAIMYANPGFDIIQGDINSGYDEISRRAFLNSIRDAGTLDNTLSFSHALMHPYAYADMVSVT